MAKIIHTIEHEGAKINFYDHGQFETSNEDGAPRFYDSLGQAKAGVEEAQKKVAAMARHKINLRCLNGDGEQVYVTGVHATHGTMLVTPNKDKSFRHRRVYPHTEEIRFALAAIEEMQNRARELELALRQFEVHVESSLDGKRRTHNEQVDRLKELHEKNLAAAIAKAKQIIDWTKGGPIPAKLIKDQKIRL